MYKTCIMCPSFLLYALGYFIVLYPWLTGYGSE